MFAHSLPGRPETAWEPLPTHLRDVSARARRLGRACGVGDWAALAGLLHDLGKSAPAFQARLRGDPGRVDHSSAGAREAVRRWGDAGKLLAYAVAGHHAGLPDGADLDERCHARPLPRYDPDVVVLPEALPPLPIVPADPALAPSLFVRMIFSCLVDADRLATEALLDPDAAARRGRDIDLDTLADRLDGRVHPRVRDDSLRQHPAQRRRRGAQQGCGRKWPAPRWCSGWPTSRASCTTGPS